MKELGVMGDNYNSRCPYCGEISHYVCNGIKIEFGKIKEFKKNVQTVVSS